MISFNSIPLLLTPGAYIEFDNSQAFASQLAPLPHRALLIGQRTSSGTVTALVPTQITGKGQGSKYFGRGSHLAAMCDAFVGVQAYVELWAIALDDLAGGAKAAGSFLATGPASAPGTLAVYIGGTQVSVGVAINDTASTIATNLVAAIAALPDLPVTAAVDGVTPAKVNLTAVHKGIAGNGIDLRINYNQGDATPAGVTLAITAMTGGTGNPDVTTAIAVMGGRQYTSIASAYNDAANLTAIETELTSRWSGTRHNDGMNFAAGTGSYASIGTFGAGRNSQFTVYRGNQNSPTLPWVQAAIDAAVDESESDPGRPRQYMPMPGMLPPANADRYTGTQRNMHLLEGVATFFVDEGGICNIERSVTTYKTNAQGIADPSYRDIEVLRLLSAIRYTVRARILTKYPRCKLGQDGSVGANVVTPKAIRGEMIALYQDWMTAGWVEGGDALQQFIADLDVEIDAQDPNRVDVILPPNLINQFRVFAAQVQFRA